jgi:serine/threonine-protein kinase
MADEDLAPTAPWSPADPPLPAQLGGHQVLGRLGAGGMGTVYVVLDPRSGARRALKTLSPAAPIDARLRFQREAEAMAKVDDHPHVARIHSAGVDGGRAYLVMDLCEGGDLGRRLRAGPLPPQEVVALGVALARGLAHVHARGVLHRDLKPANVLFDGEGRPRLVDFGLAQVQGGERLTETGAILGTPAYMAPEQASGGVVDARTDVYGLGALLYHALTGRPPFQGGSALATIARVLRDAPAAPRGLVPGVPAPLQAVVLRCLAKAPDERYPSAAALAEALEAAGRDRGARGRVPALAVLAALSALAAITALGIARSRATARPVAAATEAPAPAPATSTAPAPAEDDDARLLAALQEVDPATGLGLVEGAPLTPRRARWAAAFLLVADRAQLPGLDGIATRWARRADALAPADAEDAAWLRAAAGVARGEPAPERSGLRAVQRADERVRAWRTMDFASVDAAVHELDQVIEPIAHGGLPAPLDLAATVRVQASACARHREALAAYDASRTLGSVTAPMVGWLRRLAALAPGTRPGQALALLAEIAPAWRGLQERSGAWFDRLARPDRRRFVEGLDPAGPFGWVVGADAAARLMRLTDPDEIEEAWRRLQVQASRAPAAGETVAGPETLVHTDDVWSHLIRRTAEERCTALLQAAWAGRAAPDAEARRALLLRALRDLRGAASPDEPALANLTVRIGLFSGELDGVDEAVPRLDREEPARSTLLVELALARGDLEGADRLLAEHPLAADAAPYAAIARRCQVGLLRALRHDPDGGLAAVDGLTEGAWELVPWRTPAETRRVIEAIRTTGRAPARPFVPTGAPAPPATPR